jgi:hypothetical protein
VLEEIVERNLGKGNEMRGMDSLQKEGSGEVFVRNFTKEAVEFAQQKYAGRRPPSPYLGGDLERRKCGKEKRENGQQNWQKGKNKGK